MTASFLKVPGIRSLRWLLLAGICLLSAGLTGSLLARTLSAAPNMKITVQNELISVNLVNAPLIDVLQNLEKEFNFKAHLLGDISEPVTLSFVDMPLVKCLQRLTAKHSLSVAYHQGAGQDGQKVTRRIAEIWVLGGGATGKKPNFVPRTAIPVAPAPAVGHAAGDAGDDSADLADDTVEDNTLLDKIFDDPNADKAKQRQTVQDLVSIGDAESVLTMAEYLVTADKELRQVLVNGISAVKNEQSTLVLGQVLQSESDPDIRKIAVRTLAQRQNDSVAKGLLEEALNDKNEDVKTLAQKLLQK
jgi:HEAT repeats